jgi:hypothetical protein
MKKFHGFFIFFLISAMLLLAFISFGCNAPTIEPATEAETQAPLTTLPSETVIINEDLHAEIPIETTAETPSSPLSDISCILGYWEVEPDSLLVAANALVSSNSTIIFTRCEPSIIYAFYMGDFETETTLCRMDIWYDNVLVSANVESIEDESSKNIDMHLNGVLTAEITSEREGQIAYTPLESENHIEITDMWLNGVLMSDGPVDISTMGGTNVTREFLYECLGNGRIDIAYPEGTIYLSATTRRHD